mmetsp:Transcript_35513/g.99761  ORF Transcript_35513/g.99761 Transcript_35513/m.99761 type:complete len:528 (+) Transcript_35513:109-1692(+)
MVFTSEASGPLVMRTSTISSLTSLLTKGSGSSVCTRGRANATTDCTTAEVGDWKYLVVDPNGIRARADPCYSKATKVPKATRFKEGMVIDVDCRRRAGWTVWLRLKDTNSSACWLFDVSPKDKRVRMVEVEMVSGQWQYEVVTDEVSILPCPSMAIAKAAWRGKEAGWTVLENKDIVEVTERVRPLQGRGAFLHLADGRGWVLDFVDGRRVIQRYGTPQGCISVIECPYEAGNEVHGSPRSSFLPMQFSHSLSLGQDSAASANDGVDPPELGEWDYLVLDSKGMSLRRRPAYDTREKLKQRIEEGDIVSVVERRPGDNVTFLRVSKPPGWAFDRQPGHGSRMRMMEVNVDKGNWYYTVVAEGGASFRTRCTFSDSAKVGKGLQKGSLIAVSERMKNDGTVFLRSKETGLWVYDQKNGGEVMRGPMDVEVLPASTMASVSCELQLLSAPTNARWALTKVRLLTQARVEVQLIFNDEGVQWAFVSKQNTPDMEGWAPCESLCLLDGRDSGRDTVSSQGGAWGGAPLLAY